MKVENVFAYIKGVKDRGSEVISALERLGGTNNLCLSGDDEASYYCINCYGDITYIPITCGKWLKDNYTKISLPCKPKDKELVWAWDNCWNARKDLVFYDAQYNTAYNSSGRRCGGEYDNYVPYEGEYPEWAKEALNKLEG